jgi:hypothetical protein
MFQKKTNCYPKKTLKNLEIKVFLVGVIGIASFFQP